MESGVPQSLALGPALFLLFVNDLYRDLSLTARLFADDTYCHRPVKVTNYQSDLQKDFHRLAVLEDMGNVPFHRIV